MNRKKCKMNFNSFEVATKDKTKHKTSKTKVKGNQNQM